MIGTPQTLHDMLPDVDHDENARQDKIIDELVDCGFEREKYGFRRTPFITKVQATEKGSKGYMDGGFRDVSVLVAEK